MQGKISFPNPLSPSFQIDNQTTEELFHEHYLLKNYNFLSQTPKQMGINWIGILLLYLIDFFYFSMVFLIRFSKFFLKQIQVHCWWMMNCFCGMVEWRRAFSLVSTRDHRQRSSPSRISETPWAEFETAQNLSFRLVEWSCAAVITTTPSCQILTTLVPSS